MGDYFRDIGRTIGSILLGLGVTLRYCFAKTITVQYPDVAPTTTPSWRGIHRIEIERCIACEACVKVCPVECIAIEKSKPRRLDKASGTAVGGALSRYDIDYGKCLFCGLCTEVCPTTCIHMGDNHDLSCYAREDCVGDFVALAREGRQTPQPLWMSRPNAPSWVIERKRRWDERARPHQAAMLKTLEETTPPAAKKT